MVTQERMIFSDLCTLIAERATLTDYGAEFVLSEVEDIVIDNIRIDLGT